MKVDIHDYEKRLRYFLNKLNEIDKENKKILKFCEYLSTEKISIERIIKYILNLF